MPEVKVSRILDLLLGAQYVVKHASEPVTLDTLNRVLLAVEEKFATIEFVNSVSSACEDYLNGFQSGLNGAEHRVIQLWNSMNAIIRVFTNKSMISEDELVEAGRQLLAEANQFFQEVRAQQVAAKSSGLLSVNGEPLASKPLSSPKFPMDMLIDTLNKASKNSPKES